MTQPNSDMLRSLVREALRDALGGSQGVAALAAKLPAAAPAPTPPVQPVQSSAQVTEVVSLSSPQDMNAFVQRILDMGQDEQTRDHLYSGRIAFELAGGHQVAGTSGTSVSGNSVHIDKGAVTESMVRKAAESGATLIVGRRAVVTALAKDKAKDMNVTIIKEGTHNNQKGSVSR